MQYFLDLCHTFIHPNKQHLRPNYIIDLLSPMHLQENLASPSMGEMSSKPQNGSVAEASSKGHSDLRMEECHDTVASTIDASHDELYNINKQLHSNPETAYQEHFAHETLTTYLSSRGFDVKKHTYGLDTSFEVEVGTGGRLVIICAEYDALPQIGHACGHNLIATSSVATFLAAAEAMKRHGIDGRLRILGTPAEEGGGGKANLIEAGAIPKETAAAIMAHPVSAHQILNDPTAYDGLAGLKLIASHKLLVSITKSNMATRAYY